MPTPRHHAVAGLLAAVIVLGASVATTAGAARPGRRDRLSAPSLSWHPCAPGSPGLAAGFVCATAPVPFDYRDPEGATISLALVKHAATVSAQRIGTLFVNPGGPGGMGTSQIPAWIRFFPAELRARFDIVSWDPRGIGESTAVQCFDTADQEAAFLGGNALFPTDPAEERSYIKTWKGFSRRCDRRVGNLLEHVSTAETARDLDLLRRAVGDRQLRFLGLSYGTFLGATYANLFPDRVGALVLDGNLAPDNWTARGDGDPDFGITLRVGSDTGVGTDLAALLELCGATDTAHCAFSAGSSAATVAKFDALLARLREGPIILGAGSGSQSVTYAELVTGIGDALDIVQPFANPDIPAQSFQGWSGVAQVLEELAEAAALSPAVSPGVAATAPLANRAHAVPASGQYAGPEQSLSVICADAPNPRNPERYEDLVPFVTRRSGPVSVAQLWADLPCASWRARTPVAYTGPWDRHPAHPFLVVGNTFDPSTPYRNSTKMVKQLDDARLLTVDGYGHTELLNPSSCANDYVVAYLIDGSLPPKRTVCQQDEAPFARLNP